MIQIQIQGPTQLQGEVFISGAKNSALPLICATLLAKGKSNLHSVPKLQDVEILTQVLEHMGARYVWENSLHGFSLSLDTSTVSSFEAPYELVKKMRASILVLGPLVSRYGYARVSLPGGCAIGSRPVDQHLRGLERLGVHVYLDHGDIIAEARQLRANKIVLDMPTVGGTENLMMAATLAKGTTLIENAAREPEIEDLANMLNQMGAKIQGAGSSMIEIEGVSELKSTTYQVMPDRIEAGTFLVAGLMSQGDIWIRNCNPSHLDVVLAKLEQIGARLEIQDKSVHLQSQSGREQRIHTNPDWHASAFELTTQPYPGFPTDLQAVFLSLACVAKGTSTLVETIFENRYMHVPELNRMGAHIQVHGQTAVVNGVSSLSGTHVTATDLRAAAGLILMGLCAEGPTVVHGIHHLDRGYEKFTEKLQKLGANIKRLEIKDSQSEENIVS